MRKALRYAAAVLLLLFALGGCGGGGGESPGEASVPAAAAAVEPEPAPEVVLPAEPDPEVILPVEPEPAPEPETAEEAPAEIHGLPPETTVYVSKRSNTIHLDSGCCNMKHYREMTLGEADALGYDCCLHCF